MDLTFDDPCILFALGREAAGLPREFRVQQRFPGAPCRARFRGPAWLTVLVVETGIGPARMETALDWLLSGPLLGNVPYRPKLVLSAGFSGALQDSCRLGDIILATEVVDALGNRWPTTWPGELPAGEWRPPIQRGRLLSVSELVTSPEEKRSLGRQHDALAVDMETACVARMCSKREVPFGCIRAISDRLDTPLSPQLVALAGTGRVALLPLLTLLVRSPRMFGEVRRLARDTRLAARHLGTALGDLLTLTLPGGRDL